MMRVNSVMNGRHKVICDGWIFVTENLYKKKTEINYFNYIFNILRKFSIQVSIVAEYKI